MIILLIHVNDLGHFNKKKSVYSLSAGVVVTDEWRIIERKYTTII